MQFEYDPERLIEEVKKRPGIWDLKCVDYRIKKKRRKLWTEVVNELNPSTMTTSKSELRQLEYQLQKKWKGMRDCFIKYIQKPNRTRRPYIYLKQLQFLMKDTDNSQSGAAESSDSEAEKKKLVWKRKGMVSLKMDTNEMTDEEMDNYNDSDDNAQDDHDYDPQADRVEEPALKKMGNEFLFANVEAANTKSSTEDCDKLFLLSLLPHLMSVPDEFRLNVKVELMQVLQNANYSTTRDHKLL